MTQYIQFTDQDGRTLLVETDDTEVYTEEGTIKSGAISDIGEKAVTGAQTLFEKAIGDALSINVHALLLAVRNLPEQDQPKGMEVSFALKATGEIGNLAIAKGGVEANYTVTFTWER